MIALFVSSMGCSHDWDALDPAGGATSTTGATTSGGGSDVGGSGGSSTGGAGAGGSGSVVTYPASIAECINPFNPNPAVCKAGNGSTKLDVDLVDEQGPTHPNHAYLRFDLDDQLAGKSVDSVHLELVVGGTSGDSGGGSGEIHRVASFSLASLSSTAPANAELLAGDEGPVSNNEVVSWMLPSALAVSEGTIYLGVIPTSDDGTHYWNNAGDVPPKLVVAYH